MTGASHFAVFLRRGLFTQERVIELRGFLQHEASAVFTLEEPEFLLHSLQGAHIVTHTAKVQPAAGPFPFITTYAKMDQAPHFPSVNRTHPLMLAYVLSCSSCRQITWATTPVPTTAPFHAAAAP